MSSTDQKVIDEKIAELSKDLGTDTYGQWLFDPTKNDLQWDDSMYTLFDVSRSDFSGAYEAWMDALHPEDMEVAPKEFEKALLGTGNFESSFRIVTKDKSIKHIGARGIIDRDENGHPVFVTGINWDCTSDK